MFQRVRPHIALGDVVAGVSVALVLIPQSVAYARLAGMPAHHGLYAAALPPVIAALFASSPFLQTGPVAITALLTFGALAGLAPPGSPEYVLLGALLALVVGATRVVIGLARFGNIAYLMSEPVVRGFTTGAALLIIAAQLPGALGVDTAAGENVIGVAAGAIAGFREWSPLAVLLSGATLVLVLYGRRVHRYMPGVLVAGLLGLAVTHYLDEPLPVLGPLPAGLPRLQAGLPWAQLPAVLFSGVVIALVGFAEAASIARHFAARERQRWHPGRDFVSQGLANLVAAVSGGFPVGASFTRSGLNHYVGARSRWSGAVTGVSVLIFLPFAYVLAGLPVAVLSGVVIAAVVGLVRFQPILILWRLSRRQFFLSGGTLVLTIALAPRVDQAVVLGVMVAVVVHLWREFKVEVESWAEGDNLHLRPSGVLWFGSADILKGEILDLLRQNPDARRLTIHMERLGRIDITGALVVEGLVAEARAAGLACELRQVHPRSARALRNVLRVGRRARQQRGLEGRPADSVTPNAALGRLPHDDEGEERDAGRPAASGIRPTDGEEGDEGAEPRAAS